MSCKYGEFKYSIGDTITSHNRKLLIIDKEYRQKEKSKYGNRFVANQKYYKYRCLDCGNEDWIIEHSLDDSQHSGCNACCNPPKKLVQGINDISTTARWAVRLFANQTDALNHHKYSKDKVAFICPDCNRTYIKPIQNVIANKGLSCVCSDNISYPNKFMYALLEQFGIPFEIEKSFGWSDNKRYDFYIDKYNVIIEMHGRQHYDKPIVKSTKYRSLQEEHNNDTAKEQLAKANGIIHYYQIDSSISDKDFIARSIISSGILDCVGVEQGCVNWDRCDKFAISNFAKTVCEYKNRNNNCTLHEIAKLFRISYKTVLSYIKLGDKYNWCNYNLNDDRKLSEQHINRGYKPVYCLTTDTYYRDSKVAAIKLSREGNLLFPRQIRQAITRNNNYKGFRFVFITQSEFNSIKLNSPDKVVGD